MRTTCLLAGVGRPNTGWPSHPKAGGDWSYSLWAMLPNGVWVCV